MSFKLIKVRRSLRVRTKVCFTGNRRPGTELYEGGAMVVCIILPKKGLKNSQKIGQKNPEGLWKILINSSFLLEISGHKYF